VVKRVPRKLKTFEYEGEKFGLRPATTGQIAEVTRRLSEYRRSVKKDVATDHKDGIDQLVEQSGNMDFMFDVQKYVAELMVVDPESNENIFGKDSDHEDIDSVPGDFVRAAWFCYSGQDAQPWNAAHVLRKLGETYKKIVDETAMIDRDVLIARLGQEKISAEKIQDMVNMLDGKFYLVKSEDEQEPDPTMTAAPPMSNSEETSS
jgi:hypothetical protein